jgi:hypothetical protein
MRMLFPVEMRHRVLLLVAILALLPPGVITIPATVALAAGSACPSGGTPGSGLDRRRRTRRGRDMHTE